MSCADSNLPRGRVFRPAISYRLWPPSQDIASDLPCFFAFSFSIFFAFFFAFFSFFYSFFSFFAFSFSSSVLLRCSLLPLRLLLLLLLCLLLPLRLLLSLGDLYVS
jgi:hypothetical protein